MKIGDKVTVTMSCAGADMNLEEGQEITVNEGNINFLADTVRAGHATVESVGILSDSPRLGRKSGRTPVKPE